MTYPNERDKQLVKRLFELANSDRRALMQIRATLNEPDGISNEAYEWLAPYLPRDESQHRLYFLFAGLFAEWQTKTTRRGGGGNLGEALRRVGSSPAKRGTTDPVVKILTRGLPIWQLRSTLWRAVTLCAANGAGLDWDRLLADVTNPNFKDAQRSWAFGYHYYVSPKSGNEESIADAWAESNTKEVVS